jgi:4-amino-4-deoxy-L-arabinose transferase-like glycosyltransferase
MNLKRLMKRKDFWLLTTLLLCVFYFPLFYRLDTLVLREWDESRNAVTATEMIENNNYLIRHFEGSPDMWEVKPPFLTWIQVIGIKILGYNEFSIRLPSALSTLFLAFILIGIFGNLFRDFFPGIISALVLITSPGYMGWHVSRTGDHDSLVILLMMIAFLVYFLFIENRSDKKHPYLILIVCVALIFAYLTKSIAALLFLPGMFLFTVFTGKLKQVFRSKMFYIGIGMFIVTVGGYYLLRNHYNPGYLKEVWAYEILPRYMNSAEKFHKEPFLFYIQNMLSGRFFPWFYICFPAILLQWFFIPKNHRAFTAYVTITLLMFLIIISKGSKNVWYDAPAYPLMAIITGQFYYYFLIKILSLFKAGMVFKKVFISLTLLAVFFEPYRIIVKHNAVSHELPYAEPTYSIAYLLRDFQNNKIDLPLPLNVVYDNYKAHLMFYVNAIKATKSEVDIKFANKEDLKPGTYIVVSQQNVHDYVNTHFLTETIIQYKDATVYLLIINYQ